MSDSRLRILTANRLEDGAVVYLAASGEWTREIDGAGAAADEESAARLVATGQTAAERAVVVGPYLIDVEEVPYGLRPVSLKECIRAAGPSATIAQAFAAAYP